MDRRNNQSGYQGQRGPKPSTGGGYQGGSQGYQGQRQGGYSGQGESHYGGGGGKSYGEGYQQQRHNPESDQSQGYGRGGGGYNKFGGKPQASRQVAKPTKVKVFTNQYQMTLGEKLSVFQYEVVITPDVMQDTYVIHSIMRSIKKKMDSLLGLYVVSGRSLYTNVDLEESLLLQTVFRSIEYTVLINVESKAHFSGESLSSAKMEDHHVIFNLINIILKQAFRDTDLRQIGKQPRFFDVSKAVEVEGSGLQACPGFRASAFNYQSGLYLVLDNINKFLSNASCLERIREIQMDERIREKDEKIFSEFRFKSVIGNWGNKKAYIVHDIDFEKNPFTRFFDDHKGDKMSIAEYFLKTYELKVTDKKQPLFVVKINGKLCHLPTEFCSIDGVPQQIREDPFKMRNVLGACRKNPDQKFQAIQDFSKDLFSQKTLQDWGISIEAKPLSLTTAILPQPEINQGAKGKLTIDEQVLRKLPIQKAIKLKHDQWIICYDQRSYENANSVFSNFQKAMGQLNMQIEEPYWLEISNMAAYKEFEGQLANYMDHKGMPSIVVLLLANERQYSAFKNICYKHNIISQAVAYKTVKKMNLSVATNVLKQINSKIGGDLFNLAVAEEISPQTMLIGIDVCHSGPKSIVGFCASINKEMSQYYSEKLVQKKGQEIVDKNLKASIKNAMDAFQQHQGQLPKHFIIYRDGVGDAMRRQVLQTEIAQFKEAITETYNMAANKPNITVVIVNKRITQRFFVEDEQGRLQNPPSGCLIDTGVVENADSNHEYDFYLVPQNATQGCVLPTHFYVAYNDSDMSKETLEKFTYDLCHYYFNWAGPIKVPAPCMYAHKIAELYMNIGKDSDTKHYTADLQQSLHFL